MDDISFFFFSSRRRHTRFDCDWSSDVCSSDLVFIVPNVCNDAHDCPLRTADEWLKRNIDPLVQSATFQRDGLLIIVFDESRTDNLHGGGRIPCVIVSPKARRGHRAPTPYPHQSP